MGDEQPQQWRATDIQPVMARIKPLFELRGDIPLLRIEIDLFHHNRCMAPDNLDRLRQALPDNPVRRMS